MAGENILIVDDDQDIREIISLYLEREGYQIIFAEDGNQAVTTALTNKPDLIIMDMMLPGLDGIEVCQELRKSLTTPIIFLSSKGTALDKSLGLTAGGDDYMSKPFDAIELVARIKAHLRRNRILQNINYENNTDSSTSNHILDYPGLTIDLTSHNVVAHEQTVTLSPREFQLLVLLAQKPKIVFSSKQLFEALWGTQSLGDHRTVMVHISTIRRKIEKDPSKPVYIQTVKGVGYKFCGD